MAVDGESGPDPACELSSDHRRILELAQTESDRAPPPFVYRQLGAGEPRAEPALSEEAVLGAGRS